MYFEILNNITIIIITLNVLCSYVSDEKKKVEVNTVENIFNFRREFNSILSLYFVYYFILINIVFSPL